MWRGYVMWLCVLQLGGHTFTQVQLNIHTVCEMCGSRIWMVGYVCKVCHYAVHKKCAKTSTTKCKDFAAARNKAKVGDSTKYNPILSRFQVIVPNPSCISVLMGCVFVVSILVACSAWR